MKKTYKPYETEEWFDYFIYRPLASVIVYLVKPFPITPNQLSFLSMIFALIAAVFFFFGIRDNNYTYLIYGSISLLFNNILDCADGQLARLKKNGTPTGRIYDGLMDNISYTALYIAIAWSLHLRYNNPIFWLLGIVAGASTSIQCSAFDFYRNLYIYIASKDYKSELEDINSVLEKKKKAKGFDYILYSFYYSYLKTQQKITNSDIIKLLKNIDNKDEISELYRKTHKLTMRLWTLVGSTMHITLMIVFPLLNIIEWYFPVVIIILNSIMLIAYILQKRGDRKIIEYVTKDISKTRNPD